MSTQRRRGLHADLRTARPEKRPTVDEYPERRVPIQNEIRKLEDEGHRGHAMEVLKAHAIDFARQIDELRCVLLESAPKQPPKGESRKLTFSKS